MASSTNVKVAVRVRPLNVREQENNSKICIQMEEKTRTIVTDPKTSELRTFTFDSSYWMDAPQKDVYEDLGKPILEKALEGYNGTIFAYGQTGAGKTFTMMGESNDGIIPQMNADMFAAVEARAGTHKFLITAAFLEIYNEVVHDLLNPSEKSLKIREHPSLGVFVEGLAEIVVRRHEDIARLMDQGNKVRMVAATNMNQHSSRSHSIFVVRLSQKELGGEDDSTGLTAKLNLVDLAGSERVASTGATGDRLKEGASINQSLSELGNVINALADPKKAKGHISYRNSKLTRLLQESLGGNAMTVMIAAISPADVHYDETFSTLQYANRAKNIRNKTVRNEDNNVRVIRELRGEIERLRAMLQQTATGSVAFDPAEMDRMEEKIADLQRAKQETWEEKERLSRQYEDERVKTLEAKGIMEYVMANLRRENQELTQRLEKLQTERTRLMEEYKQRKAQGERLKEDLRQEMIAFSKRTEELKRRGEEISEEEQNKFSVALEKKRADLQRENERLKETKKNLKEVTELQKKEKEEAQTQSAVLTEDSQLRAAIAEDERQRLSLENKRFLDREQARMKRELEDQKKKVEERFKSENQAVTQDELLKMELEVIESKTEKSLFKAKATTLEEQLKQTEAALEEMKLNHELNLERQQLEHFLVFRRYREWLEEQRRKSEACHVGLLQDAIADAIHLSSRNAELEQEVRVLRAVVSGQKGVVSAARAR